VFVTADFHNHSCLSPCGSLELSPSVLVAAARERGVHVLALTDHNSARNTPAFEALCHRAGVLPLCGVEVTTAEELHCLVLFADSQASLAFGEVIEARTLKVKLRPEKHGDQVVVDADENVIDEVDFWLGAPTDLGLSDLVELGHQRGGLVIPAHIDRPSQSIKSQLGYLPPADYDALEVRNNTAGMDVGGLALVRGSDAHYPENVGERTCQLELEALTFAAVRQALRSGKVSW
jgi:predicted metal-dependent phosphoesterase TrpH